MDGRIKKWQEEGYVVLPKFYSGAEIDAAEAALHRAWNDPTSRVVVDDLNVDQRMHIRDVDPDARKSHRFKVNDLYLEYPEVRRLALNGKLTPILKSLLASTPVLCNSLSYAHGSAQGDHVDSLYMTPRTHGHLLAIWVALEDCDLDAGPLRYYPGSHSIEQFVFSNGTNHAITAEMGAWHAYMDEQIALRGLKPQVFAARRGDVFIWNAYLLHGGSPILAPGKTRKSVVFHYFSESDSRALGLQMVPEAGAYWMHRPHQPVPGQGNPAAPQLSARQTLSMRLHQKLHRITSTLRD
jgi:ectoine hydroxylase-related dioxygenase (phytanoyl-CoA dioxygenase family)